MLTWPPSGSPAVASALARRPVDQSPRDREFLKWDLFEHHQWVSLKMGNTPWENYENPLGQFKWPIRIIFPIFIATLIGKMMRIHWETVLGYFKFRQTHQIWFETSPNLQNGDP